MIEAIAEKVKDQQNNFPVFAVVLFLDSHAGVVKMLKDPDYWAGLDEASGQKLLVFATTFLPETVRYPRFPSGSIGMMVPIAEEPQANKAIMKTFNIETRKNLPALAFFTEDEDNFAYHIHYFKDDDPGKLFQMLRNLFDEIDEELITVPKNRRLLALKKIRWTSQKKSGLRRVGNVLRWLATFRGATGC